MSGADAGAGMPADRAKKPGRSACPTATTGTPRVSRYSSVAGTSRIAFGPAHTTAIGVRPSSSRSDEMSKVGWRCRAMCGGAGRRARRDGRHRSRRSRTTRIPAAWAAIIVAETVVAAHPPSARAAARLGRAALRTDPGGAVASASRAAVVQPDEHASGVDRDGRRDRAGRAHGGLRCRRDGQVLGVRQAVADQRRFEGDDRPALGERGRDLGADVESVGEHQSSGSSARGVDSWRAAAR